MTNPLSEIVAKADAALVGLRRFVPFKQRQPSQLEGFMAGMKPDPEGDDSTSDWIRLRDARAAVKSAIADRLQPLALSGAGEGEAVAWQYRSCLSYHSPRAWSEWVTVKGADEKLAREKAASRPDLYEVRPLVPLDTHPVAPGAGDGVSDAMARAAADLASLDALASLQPLADQPAAPAGGVDDGTWFATMICCGREDGTQTFDTWAKADAFRDSYTSMVGHERSVIISQIAAARLPGGGDAGWKAQYFERSAVIQRWHDKAVELGYDGVAEMIAMALPCIVNSGGDERAPTPPASAALSEGERGFATSRRRAAVETLQKIGYRWQGGVWSMPPLSDLEMKTLRWAEKSCYGGGKIAMLAKIIRRLGGVR